MRAQNLHLQFDKMGICITENALDNEKLMKAKHFLTDFAIVLRLPRLFADNAVLV